MTSARAARHHELDAALSALPIDAEAMLVGELDGYLAGILVCPDLIMPGEWLPNVWGQFEDDEIVFEDGRQAERLVTLVMAHYNDLVRDLGRGRYVPAFEIDERLDDVLWEFWINGFARAMALRPDSWDAIAESGDQMAQAAFNDFMRLALIAADDPEDIGIDDKTVRELTANAPDLISQHVATLHTWRMRTIAAPANPKPEAKVGRNDTCPCGSGRKYKRCCGAN